MVIVVLLMAILACFSMLRKWKYHDLWCHCEDEIRRLRFRLNIFSSKEGRLKVTIEQQKSIIDALQRTIREHDDRPAVELDTLEMKVFNIIQKGPVTTTNIHRELSNHVKAAELLIVLQNLVRRRVIEFKTLSTGGRPTKCWSIKKEDHDELPCKEYVPDLIPQYLV